MEIMREADLSGNLPTMGSVHEYRNKICERVQLPSVHEDVLFNAWLADKNGEILKDLPPEISIARPSM
jgi:hypothetical protein